MKDGKARLRTCHGHDWTGSFPSIAKALARLKVDSAILDGEVVAPDAPGRSDFQPLQASMKGTENFDPVYYAFDLPFLDGADLTHWMASPETVAPIRTTGPRRRGPSTQCIGDAVCEGRDWAMSKTVDITHMGRRKDIVEMP